MRSTTSPSCAAAPDRNSSRPHLVEIDFLRKILGLRQRALLVFEQFAAIRGSSRRVRPTTGFGRIIRWNSSKRASRRSSGSLNVRWSLANAAYMVPDSAGWSLVYELRPVGVLMARTIVELASHFDEWLPTGSPRYLPMVGIASPAVPARRRYSLRTTSCTRACRRTVPDGSKVLILEFCTGVAAWQLLPSVAPQPKAGPNAAPNSGHRSGLRRRGSPAIFMLPTVCDREQGIASGQHLRPVEKSGKNVFNTSFPLPDRAAATAAATRSPGGRRIAVSSAVHIGVCPAMRAPQA